MIRSDNASYITQKKAYRYYIGETNCTDPFFSDAKAYVTLNSLLFEGITTECARIRENRKLNPVFLQEIDRTVCLLKSLNGLFYSGMQGKDDRTVWRVERLQDYEVMKRTGILQSFISASKNGFLNAYTDKIDLVLMIFHLQKDDPYIDAAEELFPYPKPEEAEITLPPYVRAAFYERKLSAEEKKIRDRNGNSPAAVCDVYLKGETEVFDRPEIISEKDILKSVSLYESLNLGKEIAQDDLQSYLRIKSYIRAEICR